MGRSENITPGTSRGSTQWSPDQAFVLSEKISGGQAQRIGLARAFYNNPELLILDEPTNSLDRENEIKIVDTLSKFKDKITIVIVSHNPKPLEIADEKFVFKNGKLRKSY